jgi:peptide-methionine (S)-S-oxide reductase
MIENIILGGGCFWCLEAVFQRVKGVTEVISGYAGGQTENPDYEEVCGGQTGHAEVIKVSFDSSKIKLSEILDIFFHLHDPTTLNRQGSDTGTQYRSVIFYNQKDQKEVIQNALENAQKDWQDPIVTEILADQTFYLAEKYHQNYFNNNPTQGYCRVIISPKVTKLKEKYFEKAVD